MISAAACRAFHGAAAGVGAAINTSKRRGATRHRREVDEERHRAVSLSRTLLRAKSVVTNRNLVRMLVSFLARPERPVQAARRRLPPHTAEPPLAAFARPHPLASPAASCLRDADSAASRASRPETTALAGVTRRCAESQDRLLHRRPARRRMAGTSDLDRQIEQLRRCEYIKEAEVKALCAKAREILVEESNVQRVDAPVTVHAVARERLAAEQERGARGRAETAVKRPVRVSPLARSSLAVCGLRLLVGRTRALATRGGRSSAALT